MPVRKFRTVEEMNQPPWRKPGEPQLFRAIAAVWEMARRTNPRTFPRGVHKYRSIEEMSHAREQWDSAYIRELRAQRERR